MSYRVQVVHCERNLSFDPTTFEVDMEEPAVGKAWGSLVVVQEENLVSAGIWRKPEQSALLPWVTIERYFVPDSAPMFRAKALAAKLKMDYGITGGDS